jgi:hypothetical protein
MKNLKLTPWLKTQFNNLNKSYLAQSGCCVLVESGAGEDTPNFRLKKLSTVYDVEKYNELVSIFRIFNFLENGVFSDDLLSLATTLDQKKSFYLERENYLLVAYSFFVAFLLDKDAIKSKDKDFLVKYLMQASELPRKAIKVLIKRGSYLYYLWQLISAIFSKISENILLNKNVNAISFFKEFIAPDLRNFNNPSSRKYGGLREAYLQKVLEVEGDFHFQPSQRVKLWESEEKILVSQDLDFKEVFYQDVVETIRLNLGLESIDNNFQNVAWILEAIEYSFEQEARSHISFLKTKSSKEFHHQARVWASGVRYSKGMVEAPLDEDADFYQNLQNDS